jgi:hypothetical protein
VAQPSTTRDHPIARTINVLLPIFAAETADRAKPTYMRTDFTHNMPEGAVLCSKRHYTGKDRNSLQPRRRQRRCVLSVFSNPSHGRCDVCRIDHGKLYSDLGGVCTNGTDEFFSRMASPSYRWRLPTSVDWCGCW